MNLLLALLPVVVIFLLLVLRRTAADVAGMVGWIVAVGVVWLYFQTPLAVILRASASGVVASLPIALVVAASIWQVTLMLETGAIARIVAFIKTVSPENQTAQIMLVNIGFGTLLTALGAVPVSILPPIMLALGYTSFAAIALPAIGYDGKLLLGRKYRLAVNPNGHGGSLTALASSGALADMANRGIEYISYFQVDNPLVRVLDPIFLGLTALADAEAAAKSLSKRDPYEKLGNFCLVDGKTTIIEYSDLPAELAEACNPDGRLKFSAGSIAIHIFKRSFVERPRGHRRRSPGKKRQAGSGSHLEREIVEIAIKKRPHVCGGESELALSGKTRGIVEETVIARRSRGERSTTAHHDGVGWLKRVEWLGEDLVFRLDGKEIYRIEGSAALLPEPFFAVLNFAKIKPGPMTQKSWTMEVDWVKHETLDTPP